MQNQTLSAHVANTELLHYLTAPTMLGALNAATQRALQAELELVRLVVNETLFRQGDPGDSLYVLVEGRLAICMQNANGSTTVVDEALPQQLIGEMALLTGQARAATVYALEATALVKLSKAGFVRIEQNHPEIATRLAHNALPRLRQQQLLGILTQHFGRIEKTTLAEVQKQLEWLYLQAGDCLVRQGEPSDALYIVINGRLRVTIKPAESRSPQGQSTGQPTDQPTHEEQFVREVGPGETIGEIGVLTGSPRTATVTAVRSTTVAKLSQTAFMDLLGQYPQAMSQIARMMAGRQVGVPAARLKSPVAITFTLVAGDPATPLTAVAQRLYETLLPFGETLYLDAARFDQALGRAGAAQVGPDDPLNLTINSWLSGQESTVRYIIYVADRDGSAWTQRCIQQADRVLIIKLANGDPKLDPLEATLALHHPLARQELVLLQAEGCVRPTGTARWLQPRRVAAHHHLRLGHGGDWQRLARRITGRAVGLVLSGGGARGNAHFGVIRALNEANIPIDLIGGTSFGAVVGGVYAFDLDYAKAMQIGRLNSSKKQLLDYTLPFTSLAAGAKSVKALQATFGETCIEDLWIPFFALSCNLSRATAMVHDQGALWLALRASTAIPGVLAPVLYQGDLLVDGGVVNNFPADIMRQRNQPGVVIGVNLSPPRETIEEYDFGHSLSGWKILWQRLNPFVKPLRVPSLMSILMRSMDIQSIQTIRSTQGLVDLLIEPDAAHIRIDNYEALDAVEELGYQAARQALASWERTKYSI